MLQLEFPPIKLENTVDTLDLDVAGVEANTGNNVLLFGECALKQLEFIITLHENVQPDQYEYFDKKPEHRRYFDKSRKL